MCPFGKRRNGEAVPRHKYLGVCMERMTLLSRSVENRSGIFVFTPRLVQGEPQLFCHCLKRTRNMKNIRALEIPLDCHTIMGLDQPELFLAQELVEFGQRPGKEFSPLRPHYRHP